MHRRRMTVDHPFQTYEKHPCECFTAASANEVDRQVSFDRKVDLPTSFSMVRADKYVRRDLSRPRKLSFLIPSSLGEDCHWVSHLSIRFRGIMLGV